MRRRVSRRMSCCSEPSQRRRRSRLRPQSCMPSESRIDELVVVVLICNDSRRQVRAAPAEQERRRLTRQPQLQFSFCACLACISPRQLRLAAQTLFSRVTSCISHGPQHWTQTSARPQSRQSRQLAPRLARQLTDASSKGCRHSYVPNPYSQRRRKSKASSVRQAAKPYVWTARRWSVNRGRKICWVYLSKVRKNGLSSILLPA